MLYEAEKDISFHARKRIFQWYRANSRAWLLKHIYDVYIAHIIYISNIHKRGTLYQKYYQKFVYQKYYEKLVINIITFFIFCIAGYTFLRNLHVHVRARCL